MATVYACPYCKNLYNEFDARQRHLGVCAGKQRW